MRAYHEFKRLVAIARAVELGTIREGSGVMHLDLGSGRGFGAHARSHHDVLETRCGGRGLFLQLPESGFGFFLFIGGGGLALFNQSLKGRFRGFERLRLGSHARDAHAVHLVILCNRLDRVHASDHGTEHAVMAVEKRCRTQSDVELASVGVGTCVGHGQHSFAIVLQRGIDFIGELIARPSAAIARRIATLNHETGFHAMEGEPVIKLFGFGAIVCLGAFRQSHKVRHGERGFFKFQLENDFAFARVNAGVQAGRQCRILCKDCEREYERDKCQGTQ